MLVDVAGKMASSDLFKSQCKSISPKRSTLTVTLPVTKTDGMVFESIFAVNGTVNISTGAQRSANAADMFGFPADTYAGLNTGLGHYAGSQTETGSWPSAADPEYDFHSPVVVNYTSTGFGGATATWKDQCIEAMRERVYDCCQLQ